MKPLLICISSTRNYAWVTKAFLEGNSRWADYIIIVDQMSTDGSRELIKQCPKAILINDYNLNYSESRRAKLAFDCAREIPGEKIIFLLAIDEVLSANCTHTKDWQSLLNSKPLSIGLLKWANLFPDKQSYTEVFNKNTPFWMARVFHDDGLITTFGESDTNFDMHTNVIPYTDGCEEIYVEDFRILHFNLYNEAFNLKKRLYYHFIDYNMNMRSAISLFRMYNRKKGIIIKKKIPNNYLFEDLDIFSLVDLEDKIMFDVYIKNFIEEHGVDYYKKLDVWNDLIKIGIVDKDPRNIIDKAIHFYLEATSNYSSLFLVRIIDRILKYVY